MTERQKLVKRFEKLAPVEWRKAVARLEPDARRELANELDTMAQWAVTLSRYAESVSELTHRDAVKHCMKARARVRKALGYAYPERGGFSF